MADRIEKIKNEERQLLDQLNSQRESLHKDLQIADLQYQILQLKLCLIYGLKDNDSILPDGSIIRKDQDEQKE